MRNPDPALPSVPETAQDALDLAPVKARLKAIQVFPGSSWPNAYEVEGALIRDVYDRRAEKQESPWVGGTLAAARFIAAAREDVGMLIAEIERLRAASCASREGTSVLQAVLDAIAGTLDPSTQIADHPNVKFAQMARLNLLAPSEPRTPAPYE